MRTPVAAVEMSTTLPSLAVPTALPCDLLCPCCSDHFRAASMPFAPHRLPCGHAICGCCASAVAATPSPACPVCGLSIGASPCLQQADVVFGEFAEAAYGLVTGQAAAPPAAFLADLDRLIGAAADVSLMEATAGSYGSKKRANVCDSLAASTGECSMKRSRTESVSDAPVCTDTNAAFTRLGLLESRFAATVETLTSSAIPNLAAQRSCVSLQFDMLSADYTAALDAYIAELQRRRSWVIDSARAARDGYLKSIDAHQDVLGASVSQLRAGAALAACVLGGDSVASVTEAVASVDAIAPLVDVDHVGVRKPDGGWFAVLMEGRQQLDVECAALVAACGYDRLATSLHAGRDVAVDAAAMIERLREVERVMSPHKGLLSADMACCELVVRLFDTRLASAFVSGGGLDLLLKRDVVLANAPERLKREVYFVLEECSKRESSDNTVVKSGEGHDDVLTICKRLGFPGAVLILNMLSNACDGTTAIAAANTIRQLCSCTEDYVGSGIGFGVVIFESQKYTALMSALHRFASEAQVCCAIFDALNMITTSAILSCDVAGNTAPFELLLIGVLPTMRAHAMVPDVFTSACSLLRTLALGSPNQSCITLFREALHMVMGTLTAHPDNEAVQLAGYQMLKSVAETHPSLAEYASTVIELPIADICKSTLHLLCRLHSKSTCGFAEVVLDAMAALCKNPALAACLLTNGVLPTLCNAVLLLGKLEPFNDIHMFACMCLARMAVGPTEVHAVIAAGGIQVAVSTLQYFDRLDMHAPAEAVKLLSAITRTSDEACASVLLTHVPEALLAALLAEVTAIDPFADCFFELFVVEGCTTLFYLAKSAIGKQRLLTLNIHALLSRLLEIDWRRMLSLIVVLPLLLDRMTGNEGADEY